MFAGVVRLSRNVNGFGNVVVIRHDNGLETVYGNNAQNLVKVGQKVKAGDLIGLTGRTGRATTPHLHFEVKWKGHRFNPVIMFNCTNHSLHNVTMTFSKSGKVTATTNK